MSRGKEICKVLKAVRRRIAEENGIALEIPECTFKGKCRGTCPRCEAELRYLDAQLRTRRNAGRAVKIAGIAAGALALLSPHMLSASSSFKDSIELKSANSSRDSLNIIKGVVYEVSPDSVEIEPLFGATVTNLRTGIEVFADIDGQFEIPVNVGDSLRFSFIGCNTIDYVVSDYSDLRIEMECDLENLSSEVVVTIGAFIAPKFGSIKLDNEQEFLKLSIFNNSDVQLSPEIWDFKLEVFRIGSDNQIDNVFFDDEGDKYLAFEIDANDNIIIKWEDIIKYLDQRYFGNKSSSKCIIRIFSHSSPAAKIDSPIIDLSLKSNMSN